MKVSIIIPVYNEERTIEEIVRRVQVTEIQKEVIVVNDGSTDRTSELLRVLQTESSQFFAILNHEKNCGKGMAIRTGLTKVTGDLVLIQDADLEYNPNDYPALIAPFADPKVKVVYGSRNLRSNPHSTFAFYWGGRLLSIINNFLLESNLTDIATGYKIFSTRLIKDMDLRGNGFEFCVEVTAKILQSGVRIVEVPISYTPRYWEDGKKIRWHDGLIALWTLIRYRFNQETPKTDTFKVVNSAQD